MLVPIRAEPLSVMSYNEAPSVLGEGQRWYVVHTVPSGEARAKAHLENQRFRTFLPRSRKTVRHARKVSVVDSPYFPRYLFVALDLRRDQWRSINGTFGVSRLVMQADRPISVPAGVVETLIASSNSRGVLQQQLVAGQRVRMIGPFADQLATLDQLDDSGRVRLLFEFLGRQVTVSSSRDAVFPV